ncbi:hypothetical protein niasHS_015093 [Heterodera schachtii]|uniref:Uncharacterized protein n=1 Tax=Heterodera schachtii TaxID=97005 RepID=A0ABD2I541_HETSC
MADKMKLGICISWGRTGGRLMVPPSNEPIRPFTLIWNKTDGLVALLGQKLEKGTWVLFTLSTRTAFLHSVDRKLVDRVSITDQRRETAVDILFPFSSVRWSLPFHVMAFVRSFRRYNDYYRIGMDQLIGWVLVSEDSFVRRVVLQENLAAQMSIIFKHDCVRGFNWVAVSVNERRQEGTECYRKLELLPRFMDDNASMHYNSREKQFATRYQLQNPLPSIFVAEYGDCPTMKKMLADEYALGLLFGFEKDYERDINGADMLLKCLVVFKCAKAALVYNKQHHIGVVRSCDFGSQFEFDSICQLGKWVSGKFTRPYLMRQFELEYNLMLCDHHQLHQIQLPFGPLTRIRHFRDRISKRPIRGHVQYEETETYETVMVKVPVHFSPRKLKKVKRRMLKGRSGMVVNTVWGNIFVDNDAYSQYNFQDRHLALWVSCVPQRITTLSHENCFWYFVGALEDDPFKPDNVHNTVSR